MLVSGMVIVIQVNPRKKQGNSSPEKAIFLAPFSADCHPLEDLPEQQNPKGYPWKSKTIKNIVPWNC